MIKILDGKDLAQKIKNEITEKVNALALQARRPKLTVIIVGEHEPSKTYVNTKIKACENCGINGEVMRLPATISTKEVITKIKQLNNDKSIDGILVQLPLPNNLDTLTIVNSITVGKDVDGLTNVNAGRLLQNDKKAILPCTVKGILELLNYYQIDVYRKNITIINDSNIVGKPLTLLLNNLGATVTMAHKATKDVTLYTKQADIICTATGVRNIISKKQVKKGVIIIDIAINYNKAKKVIGDIDFTAMKKKAAAITPVPGGVGPMTIAMLLVNLMICYEQNNNNK